MVSKCFKASIIGGSGYAAAEVIRRLIKHPMVELVRVASIDWVGKLISEVHLNLEGYTNLVFEDLSPKEVANGVDIVFLCVPKEVSAEIVPKIANLGPRIIDLSGGFRFPNHEEYQKRTGLSHPSPDWLGKFVYGLPELNRDLIQQAQFVASPGCFATTIELGLLPLAKQGWLSGQIHTTAMTGSSGSGATAKATTHHPVRSANIRTYLPLKHQQVPEIEMALGVAGAPQVSLQMIPISAPLPRGLFASSFVNISKDIDPKSVLELYRSYYAATPAVRVPESRLPEVVAIVGTNYAEVGVVIGEENEGFRLITCISALDNVVKGGAGQAVQNMNLMLGLDEMCTLDDVGAWP